MFIKADRKQIVLITLFWINQSGHKERRRLQLQAEKSHIQTSVLVSAAHPERRSAAAADASREAARCAA